MKGLILNIVSCFVVGITAHGGILSYNIAGTNYMANPYKLGDMATNGVDGNGIPDLTSPSIQRPYYWYPIEDPLSTNMSCNYNGISNAPDLHASVAAGGNITAIYATTDLSIFPYQLSWRHSHGPMLVYLARCPGDTCANFDPTGTNVWFKISQTGLTPSAKDMTESEAWYQAYVNGWGVHEGGWTIQLPSGLKKGAYLIRHEIIMLAANPAQFYPNCAQIRVTGEGEKEPKSEDLVAFPGAYKTSDPGIEISDWAMGWQPAEARYNTTDYKFPGPKVWTGLE